MVALLGAGSWLSRGLAEAAAATTPSTSSSSTAAEGPEFKQALEVPLAVLILILYIVLGHTLELWKDAQAAEETHAALLPPTLQTQRRTFLCTFHESGPAILLGLAVGLMMNYGVGEQFDFDADVFFYVVLPPIIFHQGYAFKKRNFFKFFHYIFSFGFLGTLIQFAVITVGAFYVSDTALLSLVRDDGVSIGLSLHECLLFAAVLSAADEVATLSLIKQKEYPKLSAVLFGEGVLNDAMSILLFHAVRQQNKSASSGGAEDKGAAAAAAAGGGFGLGLLLDALWLLVTAIAVGVGAGLLISRMLKVMPSLRGSPVRQTAILMLGGYFAFSLSEALELSGILAVFFSGLTLSHYAWHSLGPEAQTTSKITSDTASMIAEAYCFAAIGLSVHEFDASQWCLSFIAMMVVVLMVARALAIYGICLVGWFFSPKSFSMPLSEQHVLFFGGMVRGAISWAQVVQIKDPHRGVMITTTLGVILFTVVFFGAVMPFFTRHLEPESDNSATTPSVSSKGKAGAPGAEGFFRANGNGSGPGRRLPQVDSLSNVDLSIPVHHHIARGHVHRAWIWFDNRFMKALFGGAMHQEEEVEEEVVDLADLPPGAASILTVGSNSTGAGAAAAAGQLLGSQPPLPGAGSVNSVGRSVSGAASANNSSRMLGGSANNSGRGLGGSASAGSGGATAASAAGGAEGGSNSSLSRGTTGSHRHSYGAVKNTPW